MEDNMPSEHFETIFRRDLDRLPGLADDEWLPRVRARPHLTRGGVGALTAIALLAIVVGLSLQAVRDAQVTQSGGAATASSYFIAVEPGAEASSTSIIANALMGSPVCPVGQLPWIAISHPSPPGDLPGTGAASADAAVRRANPTVTEFMMYPWGDSQPARGDDPRIRGGGPVWIVAGSETFVAQAPGRAGDANNWFAYPAKFMGCKAPSPANLRSTGGG